MDNQKTRRQRSTIHAIANVCVFLSGILFYWVHMLKTQRDITLTDALVFASVVGFEAYMFHMIRLHADSGKYRKNISLVLSWNKFNATAEGEEPDMFTVTPLGTVRLTTSGMLDMSDIGGTIVPACHDMTTASEHVIRFVNTRRNALATYLGDTQVKS